jgi:Tfp pilus assembly protein PilN
MKKKNFSDTVIQELFDGLRQETAVLEAGPEEPKDVFSRGEGAPAPSPGRWQKWAWVLALGVILFLASAHGIVFFLQTQERLGQLEEFLQARKVQEKAIQQRWFEQARKAGRLEESLERNRSRRAGLTAGLQFLKAGARQQRPVSDLLKRLHATRPEGLWLEELSLGPEISLRGFTLRRSSVREWSRVLEREFAKEGKALLSFRVSRKGPNILYAFEIHTQSTL